MNRRSFVARCAAGPVAAIAAAGCSSRETPSAKPPNIIFILADDLGYGDLGCYGQKTVMTPNIDRLASEGIRFTDHYAGSTVCAPSRCCLMTGLHTGHAFIRGNRQANRQGQQPIPEDTVTVAKILKQAGYRTALIGKWGLGGPGTEGHPNRQGFDYFFGYLCQGHAHNYYPEFLYRNSERVPLEGNVVDAAPNYDGAGVARKKTVYSHDRFVEDALSFVGSASNDPFFLYLALTIPHANNEAGKEGMEVPSDAPYSERDWPQQQKNHAAMITRMDSDIGHLMARLSELGIDRDTVVLFSSDNGPHREGGADPAFFDSNGPFRGIKRDLYEGGIRVPLIVRWTGHVQEGSVTGHVSAFWDFLPTAAHIAGVEHPPGIDGISYLPALTGGKQAEHGFLYWEFHEGSGTKQAVRMGDWKAVRNSPSLPVELYNLKGDIGEEHDVSLDNGDIVAEAERLFLSSRNESEFWTVFERA